MSQVIQGCQFVIKLHGMAKFYWTKKWEWEKREQIWRKYRRDHQLKAYQVERAKFNRKLRNKKGEKLLADITEHCGDSKYIYNQNLELCGGTNRKPSHKSVTDLNLAEDFTDCFVHKIKNIRNNLANLPLYKCVLDQSIEKFTNFHPVSEDVAKLIKAWPQSLMKMIPSQQWF